MANYDVGNILINIETKANNTIKTVDNLINRLNALQSRLNKLNRTNTGIDKANNSLRKTTKELDNINNKSKSASKSFSTLFNLGKIYFLINYFKRVGTAIGNMASNAVNFNETLNKFQVSMKGYYPEALGFVNELTKAFNLSTESVMDYQSTFNNMLSALGGLSQETSYYLSESLTRMAIDYASLFNVSVETAMSQFESALAGQVRSIRSTSGFDITERTLYGVYQELGGTKTMRQLSQLEKRLLIVLAIQKQMVETGVITEKDGEIVEGDFEKTLTNVSNMLKQIQETLKEVSMWLGQLMMTWLKPLIERVLAGTVALREMLKTINIMAGYTMPDFRTEEQKIKESVDDTTESVGDLEEALEEVKNTMLGFDKLNILGSSSAELPSEDLSLITDAISQYSTLSGFVGTKADEISKSILNWVGFTYNATTQLWEFNHSLKTTEDIIAYISTKLGELGNIAINKLLEVAPRLPKLIEGILDGIVEVINKELEVIGDNLDGILEMLDDYFISGTDKLFDIISKLFDGIVSNIIVGLVENLPQLFEMIANSLTTTQIGLLDLITNLIGTILENLPRILGSFKGDFAEILITQLLNVFDTALPRVLGTVVTFVMKIIETILTFIPNLINAIISQSTENENFLKDLGQGFVEGWGMEGFAGDVSSQWKESISKIASSWSQLFSNIFNAIMFVDWERLWNGFIDIMEKVGDAFKNLWQDIKTWFSDNIIKPIGNLFIGMFNKVIDMINKISFDIPNWIPGIGGKTFGFNIANIPALANGGVITRPTMAMVGEYSGASSNPEIVTPENKMKEVFTESMLPLVQAVINGDQQVIQAINGLANRPIEMNGRKVSEAIYNDLQSVATRKGQQMFSRN